MGRPLNKKYFGEPTPGGNEMKVRFNDGTGAVAGWVVKQLGSKRFRCTNGTLTADCLLVDKAQGDLLANEMSITVLDDSATPHRVVKIAAHTVTTASGTLESWTFDDSAVDGRVEMEEAGNNANVGNVALGGSDDFEV